MARPKKEGMDYFPHDTDAVNDEKIESLRLLYGNDGYAFYFILLERIYRTKGFELDVSDAETIQILAKKVSVSEEKFLKMLETSLKRECFNREAYEERKVITSDGIKKRASVVVEKRVKMRDKYKQTKDDEVSDAETPQGTTGETPQSKVKESKEKKSKEDKSKKEEEPAATAAENPVTFFESNLGRLSPIQMQEMWEWSDDFNGQNDILIHAMKIALDRNKKNMGFVKYLLKNWQDRGAKTLNDVQALETEWNGGKQNEPPKQHSELTQKYDFGF
jgi:DnaD/phage-associated family protein